MSESKFDAAGMSLTRPFKTRFPKHFGLDVDDTQLARGPTGACTK